MKNDDLIKKWEDKHISLLKQYTDSGSKDASIRSEMKMVIDFIEDLKKQTVISESDLLPKNYVRASKPDYKGSGNHSVRQLEGIAGDFVELCYQNQLRFQKVLELANIEIVK